MKRKNEPRVSQYAYPGLDRLIHERARLSLLTSLARYPKGLRFADLKSLCALTDGNLSRHLQVLQEAGLVQIVRSFGRSRPQTTCRLTRNGYKRYAEYLSELEQVVRDAAGAVRERRDALASAKE